MGLRRWIARGCANRGGLLPPQPPPQRGLLLPVREPAPRARRPRLVDLP
jgi:hypothetical protein